MQQKQDKNERKIMLGTLILKKVPTIKFLLKKLIYTE